MLTELVSKHKEKNGYIVNIIFLTLLVFYMLQVVCSGCSVERRYLIYLQKEGRVCNACIKEFSGHKSPGDAHFKDPMEGDETTVMSGYVKRLCGGKTEDKFYRLFVNKTLYIYGAHQDTTATHVMMLIGYSVQGVS
ncbi:hypothetical protein GBAR_LOCUS28741 [Geodia barretti]|uniref:Uncharacterized protein n=1 Tax=Geodia barretti TaxID=519541 RepID=A0AA35XCN3_GEOBA|nr:hypothetical protein GBAR_LOCUS28741 [Geodia barretti]